MMDLPIIQVEENKEEEAREKLSQNG